MEELKAINIGAGLRPELIEKIKEFNTELYKKVVEGAEEARKQDIIKHRAEIIGFYPREMNKIPAEIVAYEGEMDEELKQIAEISLIHVLQDRVLGCCSLRIIIQALNRIGKSIENEPWSSHINLRMNSPDFDDMLKMLSEMGISKKFQKELLEKVINDTDSNIGVSIGTLEARKKLGIEVSLEEILKMTDLTLPKNPLWSLNTYAALRDYKYEIGEKRRQILKVYEETKDVEKARKKAKKIGIF